MSTFTRGERVVTCYGERGVIRGRDGRDYSVQIGHTRTAYAPFQLAPAICPFCHRAAHARACAELRAVLFASDPPPDVPPGQDEYPGIDYPEDEERR